MPDDKAKVMSDEALHHVMAELDRGRYQALTNCLSAMGRFHRYSWNNALLIHTQRPEATRVAGIHAWHDMGRSVKKGEKGIAILVPVLQKQKEPPSPTKEPAKSGEVTRSTGFRTGYVFDVSQTEGKSLTEPPQPPDLKQYIEKIKEQLSRHGIGATYHPDLAPAVVAHADNSIRLAPGLSPPEEFEILTSKLATQILDHSRRAGQLPFEVRMAEPAAVAYVVSQAAGIKTDIQANDYVEICIGGKRALADSLAVIQKTSSKILDELLPERQRAQSPQRISTAAPAERPTPPDRDPSPRQPQTPAANTDRSDSMTLDR